MGEFCHFTRLLLKDGRWERYRHTSQFFKKWIHIKQNRNKHFLNFCRKNTLINAEQNGLQSYTQYRKISTKFTQRNKWLHKHFTLGQNQNVFSVTGLLLVLNFIGLGKRTMN